MKTMLIAAALLTAAPLAVQAQTPGQTSAQGRASPTAEELTRMLNGAPPAPARPAPAAQAPVAALAPTRPAAVTPTQPQSRTPAPAATSPRPTAPAARPQTQAQPPAATRPAPAPSAPVTATRPQTPPVQTPPAQTPAVQTPAVRAPATPAPRPQPAPAPPPQTAPAPTMPAPTPSAAPAPAPAAPAALSAAARAALPFTVDLPAGFQLFESRAAPGSHVYSARKAGKTYLMIYVGPSSQFPIYDGEQVTAAGRVSVVVTEGTRRIAMEHLFQQSRDPAEIHVWLMGLDGADRDEAERIAQTLDPK
ncbi:hypothetical protein ACFPIF_08855 [Brevundimonas faecalis]|uniref:hypothetical protein n=1 Tax=Brevundimonas faecalis TaxID=947378 RepID=UPI0036116E0F